MDAQLAALCRQTVQVRFPSGASTAGDPTWATAVAYSARVEGSTRVVEAADGSRRQTDFRVILVPKAADVLDARTWDRALVTLPWDSTSDVAKGRPVVQAKALPGETGTLDYVEVYL